MTPETIRLRDVHREFIEHLKSKEKAGATILAYGKDVDQLICFLEELKKAHLHEITGEDIQAFIARLSKNKYTPKSISRKLNSTRTFYKFLKINEYVTDDPSLLVSHPQFQSKPPRILSKLEYRGLRDAAREDPRISAVIELLLQTGIRIGELANLRIGDIADSELKIQKQGNHQARNLPLNKPAKIALERYLLTKPESKDNHLFLTKTGRPLLIRNIRSAIDRYFRLAEIKEASVNSLRHTFVAHHLLSGASVALVSKLAGHKRLSTTEKYLDILKTEKNEGNFKLVEL